MGTGVMAASLVLAALGAAALAGAGLARLVPLRIGAGGKRRRR